MLRIVTGMMTSSYWTAMILVFLMSYRGVFILRLLCGRHYIRRSTTTMSNSSRISLNLRIRNITLKTVPTSLERGDRINVFPFIKLTCRFLNLRISTITNNFNFFHGEFRWLRIQWQPLILNWHIWSKPIFLVSWWCSIIISNWCTQGMSTGC